MRKLWFLFLIAGSISAQTINPNSQITWPRVTGSGAPTGTITCPATVNNPTNATVGTPYTDITGPHYWQCTSGGWFQVDGAGGNITDFKHNGALLTGQFAVNPQIYDYDETAIAAAPGYVRGIFHDDTATGKWNIQVPTSNALAPLITAPAAGQYVILYPHTFTVIRHDSGNDPTTGFADGTAGGGTIGMGTNCSLSFTNEGQWSGYTLADYGIDPANVTAVYAFSVASYTGYSTGRQCFFTPGGTNPAAGALTTGGYTTLPPYGGLMQQVTTSTSIVGTGIASVISDSYLIISGDTQIYTTLNIGALGLIVYYTGTPVTSPTYLNVAAPLTYDKESNTLGLSATFPTTIHSYPLGSQPSAQFGYQQIIAISGTTNCQTPSGNARDIQLCKATLIGTTYTWIPVTSGGGTSGTYFTETVTCTTTCTLAHTPTTFLNLARNGLVQYYTSDFTQSGVTITLVDPAVGGDTFYAQYYY